MLPDKSVKLEDALEARAVQVAVNRRMLQEERKSFPVIAMIDTLIDEGFSPTQAGKILNRSVFLAHALQEKT